jgi:hypothetical protein
MIQQEEKFSRSSIKFHLLHSVCSLCIAMSGWVPREANSSVDLVSAIEAAAENNSWDDVEVGPRQVIIYSSFDV